MVKGHVVETVNMADMPRIGVVKETVEAHCTEQTFLWHSQKMFLGMAKQGTKHKDCKHIGVWTSLRSIYSNHTIPTEKRKKIKE